MTDQRETELRNPGGTSPEEFDRDVDIRGVVWTGVGLAAVTAAAFVLMWFFFQGLIAGEEARDPEPLPMPEAAERAEPPGPRLQTSPEEELQDMLAEEEARLESYGLAGEEGEHARIPIERAMELALERGLGRSVEETGAEGMPAAGEAVQESPGEAPAMEPPGADALPEGTTEDDEPQ